MNGSQWINQSESASFSRDIVVSSRILLAEGILLRSNGIEPSSVSKGAPRISIYLFLRGVEDTPIPVFLRTYFPASRWNLKVNFFFVLLLSSPPIFRSRPSCSNVCTDPVLSQPRSPSLFIASPPPSRSSISEANSCKPPSSSLVPSMHPRSCARPLFSTLESASRFLFLFLRTRLILLRSRQHYTELF